MIPITAFLPQISHRLVFRNDSTTISQAFDARMAAHAAHDETGGRMELLSA